MPWRGLLSQTDVRIWAWLTRARRRCQRKFGHPTKRFVGRPLPFMPGGWAFFTALRGTAVPLSIPLRYAYGGCRLSEDHRTANVFLERAFLQQLRGRATGDSGPVARPRSC